jgi:putative oxygen-independent coproporphyrinogen III oxidase
MHIELDRRKDYLQNENVETIYFGGGTPSILETSEISGLLKHVNKIYTVSRDAEITLEANPDDLTKEKIHSLNEAGINRLSIGIQSFRDEDLQWMNRAHKSAEALQCVKDAKEEGINNITIDLIYGIPGMSDDEWKKNLEQAIALDVPHISAYCLTVEPGTALDQFVKKKKVKPVDEEQSSRHFLIMMRTLQNAGYISYEISNFGKEGFFSRHNSSYWKGAHYLGIGPSAHSYNGSSRSYTIANNAKYMHAIANGTSFSETEDLTEKNIFNEYIMTGLRTIWGISEKYISDQFSETIQLHFKSESDKWKRSGHLVSSGEQLILTTEARLLADKIIGEIFIS